MGEIIKFPGEFKNKKAIETEMAEQAETGKIVNFADIVRDKEGQGNGEKIDARKITELLMLVSGLISRTNGRLHGEAYQTRRRLVNEYTDQQIIAWINNFDSGDVAARPLFYSALLDVAIARELFPFEK